MFSLFEKSDSQIQEDVKNEFQWDPSVSDSKIAITVNDGIVTLRGSVPHYFEKKNAEMIAQRVGGVRAVADEIEVNLLNIHTKTDEDIAKAAIHAMDWNYQIPEGIKISVDKGWVTLRGETTWAFQKRAAAQSVEKLNGVRGISNEITIITRVQTSDVKTRIEDALKRTAVREGRKINVAIQGSSVTLTGNVHSNYEIGDAGLAAWNAPGVLKVENNLKLTH